MIRWIRIAAIGGVVLSFVAVGIGLGLLLVENSGWVVVRTPELLVWLFGQQPREVWLPALLGGWIALVIMAALLLTWSMYYVWRRRQYERLIGRLESELAMLRNLPFTRPAPLEDLPADWEREQAQPKQVRASSEDTPAMDPVMAAEP